MEYLTIEELDDMLGDLIVDSNRSKRWKNQKPFYKHNNFILLDKSRCKVIVFAGSVNEK